MDNVQLELICFWGALLGYTLATVFSIFGFVLSRWPERILPALMGISWLLHTTAIGIRWDRLDHLPLINIFEQLSANIWGLMAALLIGYWRMPKLRALTALLMPVIMLLTAWMLMVPKEDSALPYTFHTVWLFIHIALIKIFLGSAFVALGIAAVILLRRQGIWLQRLACFPDDNSLDATAYRCMALAIIFDTLGVIAGAIWAQNAWGRYWAWVPVEVWSLITWLAIGMMLHVRSTFRTSPQVNSMLIVLVFVIAFFTFFGIPFVSESMHQGTF